MDGSLLLVSFLFGTIGTGMLMYARKAGRLVPAGAGLALMIVPYFIPNLLVLTLVCGAITAVPWFLRDM